MPQIGFTHGILYRVMEKYSAELFGVIAESGSEIIEIMWNDLGETEMLSFVIPHAKKYPRVSIHLPTGIRYADNEETRNVLMRATELYQSIGAELVVVHPDLIDDATVFDRYPISCAIENMDCRKKSFRNVEDLRAFFTAHDHWGMVLDVNHAFSNDPSMKLADDFIAEFTPRIKQIHLSGYAGYHEPLFVTKQEIIMDYCKKLDVPIIIESTFDAAEDVKKEFEYVHSYLNASMALSRAARLAGK